MPCSALRANSSISKRPARRTLGNMLLSLSPSSHFVLCMFLKLSVGYLFDGVIARAAAHSCVSARDWFPAMIRPETLLVYP